MAEGEEWAGRGQGRGWREGTNNNHLKLVNDVEGSEGQWTRMGMAAEGNEERTAADEAMIKELTLEVQRLTARSGTPSRSSFHWQSS